MLDQANRDQASAQPAQAPDHDVAAQHDAAATPQFTSDGHVPPHSPFSEHPSAPTASERAFGKVAVKVDAVNVRTSPEKAHNVLGVLYHHEEVEQTGLAGEWAKVKYRGGDAFVHADLVAAANKPVTAPPAHVVHQETKHDQAAPTFGHVGGQHSEATGYASPPSAAPAPAAAAPGTFVTASGNTIATTDEKTEANVLNEIRHSTHRFDPTWLTTAQKKLGVVDATGAMNTETLRALRAHEGRKVGADDIMNETFLQGLGAKLGVSGEPLATGAEDGFANQPINPHAHAPADLAAQAVGYADYKSYKGDWVTLKFLEGSHGPKHKAVRGHKYLQARLSAAEAFLTARHAGKAKDVRDAIGWNGELVGSYDDEETTTKSHQHTMGLAIDIDPGQNPFMFSYSSGETEEVQKFWRDEWTANFAIAMKVYGGGGDAITATGIDDWAKQGSTEELSNKVSANSAAFVKLLELSETKDHQLQVETLVKAGYSQAEAEDKVKKHVSKFAEWFRSNRYGRSAETHSFTNITEELLLALRDAGGLAWGGAEISPNENGDFMHFDSRDTDFGRAVYHKHRDTKKK